MKLENPSYLDFMGKFKQHSGSKQADHLNRQPKKWKQENHYKNRE